jgi:hypothetical protein
MTSTIRRAIVRLAALALPVAAVACIGGVDNKFEPQVITPDSTGSTGGTGGSGGSAIGVWQLASFGGHAMPDTVINVNVSSADSSRQVFAVLDSAILQLDSDSVAFETDFYYLQDFRSSQVSGANFSFTNLNYQINYTGTFLDTLSTQTSFVLNNFIGQTAGQNIDVPAITYTVNASADSLTGTMYYQFADTMGVFTSDSLPAQVPLVWTYLEPASDQRATSSPRGTVRKGRRVIIQQRPN